MKTNKNLINDNNEMHEYEFICRKCGKPYKLLLKKKYFENGKFRKFCSLSCANSRIRTEETKNKISKSIRNWIKNNPEKIEQSYKFYTCKVCGKQFTMKTERNVSGRTYCSLECKHKYLSDHTGGYRKGSGRGKSGWYKGIYCDSSWELAFVIFHIDNNLFIERCKEKRKYLFNGKEHIYIPDFITDEGIIEIKGYKTDQWIEKQKSNPDIKVLYKNDIKFYLDYVIQKYGNDFIRLYDNSNKYEKDFSKQKYVWISNPKLQKNTMIYPNKLDEYLNNGWILGIRKYN